MDKAIEIPSVYVETTIVSYLAARPSRELVVASRQSITHQWWNEHRYRYRLFAAAPVILEAREGDSTLAEKRLVTLTCCEILDPVYEIEILAAQIQQSLNIPWKARLDALHLAYTVYYKINFLLTWNLTHIANPSQVRLLWEWAHENGLWKPLICTPQELVESQEDN